MKTCPKGHPSYPFELAQCPTCKKDYRKAYYDKNKDREREKNKVWLEANREHVLAEKRNRHRGNPGEGQRWYAILKQRKPLYTVYNNMIGRCLNPKDEKYPTYGARGITVCGRWLGEDGYSNFEKDMGPRPSPSHSIDRKKNDGNYEPGNCHWATRREQQRNRKANRNIAINGRTQCVSAWAEEAGLKVTTLQRRVAYGWTGERLLLPADQRYNRLK